VDIDALETFLERLRTALREFARAGAGAVPRKGGRPTGREAAVTAFRLVEFHTGSGIATLEPSVPTDPAALGLQLDDTGEPPSVATLRALVGALHARRKLPDPVVDALAGAQRAMGDDGSFGIAVSDGGQIPRVVIDPDRVNELRQAAAEPVDAKLTVTGRLHMIEADLPNRRVGIRAQDGTDWTCTYPDELHAVVTKLVERLVRVSGTGRRTGAVSGRFRIETLDAIEEVAQETLFTVDTIPDAQLRAEQRIDAPQGLSTLVDEDWKDDEEGRRFLEATLGSTLP
jgi:hypothetical protein